MTSGDNLTHHLVNKTSGDVRCVYCNKTRGELATTANPEPTTVRCPSAPKLYRPTFPS